MEGIYLIVQEICKLNLLARFFFLSFFFPLAVNEIMIAKLSAVHVYYGGSVSFNQCVLLVHHFGVW